MNQDMYQKFNTIVCFECAPPLSHSSIFSNFRIITIPKMVCNRYTMLHYMMLPYTILCYTLYYAYPPTIVYIVLLSHIYAILYSAYVD